MSLTNKTEDTTQQVTTNFISWAHFVSGGDDDRLRDTAHCIAIARPAMTFRIGGLRQSKGHLFVMWNAEPEEDEREFVEAMWALVATEAAEVADHFVPQWSSGYGYKELP